MTTTNSWKSQIFTAGHSRWISIDPNAASHIFQDFFRLVHRAVFILQNAQCHNFNLMFRWSVWLEINELLVTEVWNSRGDKCELLLSIWIVTVNVAALTMTVIYGMTTTVIYLVCAWYFVTFEFVFSQLSFMQYLFVSVKMPNQKFRTFGYRETVEGQQIVLLSFKWGVLHHRQKEFGIWKHIRVKIWIFCQ